MARTAPHVDAETLTLEPAGSAQTIMVGTAAWFAWLESATAFTFVCSLGSFTARRERASSGRGAGYWRAYRHVDGTRRRAYLGRSVELSPERLWAVAAHLASPVVLKQARDEDQTIAPRTVSRDRAHVIAEPRAPELLATKLYLPRARPDLVVRPQLLARLDAGLQGALTLVSAPAGFGKSTLIAEWLRRAGRAAAWLALDAGDSDPAVFLRYLVAALQKLSPEAGVTMLPLLQLPQLPPLETLLTSLLNDLAELPQESILVLDDYHVLESPLIHQALAFLLDHLPPALHLVIATREDPPLPLARMRARRQVAELRAGQLRFSAGEIDTFLTQVMELRLTAADVAALEARTEGWIAGLQLAGLAMQDRDDRAGFIAAFTGSNRYVVDYLVDEVLTRQPGHIQTFLLRTSILGRMCGPLCDAVLGAGAESAQPHPQAKGQPLLEQLERANLFVIPLDAERRWYRYHHLFAEVLGERLRQSARPGEIAALHAQASAWFAQHGWALEAIQHALAADAPDFAGQLIESHGHNLIARGELLALTRWLRLLPDTTLRSRPRLLVLLAWLLPNTGALADVARYRAEAEALLADRQDPVLRGEFLALQLQPLIFQDRAEEVIALGRQALQHLPADHFFHSVSGVITGLAYLRQGQLVEAEQILTAAVAEARERQSLFFLVSGLSRLAMVAAERGRFMEAEQRYAEALAACRSASGALSPIAGMALVGLGRLRRWQGRVGDATSALVHGLELCALLNAAPFFFLDGHTGLAEQYLDLGSAPEALQQLALAEERVQRFANPTFMAIIAAHRASVWRAQGDPAFLTWLHDRHSQLGGTLIVQREQEYHTLIRGLLDTGQLASAAGWIDRLAALAQTAGRRRSEVDLRVLRAAVLLRQGDAPAARAALSHALALAAPMGYVGAFLNDGAALAALLQQAAAADGDSPFVAAVIAALPDVPAHALQLGAPVARHAAPPPPRAGLIEPLTPRELEILRLIADGASNGEIAERLIISLGTVKKHTSNILGKLQVQSRTQAIARARALMLL